MKASFDEIRRMSYRALQAANVPPGIEEDAAWGCAWLQAAGCPGMKLLADTLDRCDGKAPDSTLAIDDGDADCGGRSAIFLAANAVDYVASGAGSLKLRNLSESEYLLPFAVRACEAGTPVTIEDGDNSTHDAMLTAGDCDYAAERARVSGAIAEGISVDAADYDRVRTYSIRILVPETEESRLSGAGAGLTDND